MKLTEKHKVIAEFMDNNKLKLNGDKTHLMLLATHQVTMTGELNLMKIASILTLVMKLLRPLSVKSC